MKRLFAVLMLVASMNVTAADWTLIGVDDQGETSYIDKQGLLKSGDIVRATIRRILPLHEAKLLNGKYYVTTIIQFEFQCMYRWAILRTGRRYTLAMEEVWSIDNPNGQFERLRPGSQGEGEMNAACEMARGM